MHSLSAGEAHFCTFPTIKVQYAWCLFSQEMLAQQQKDDRYRRSLRLLAEEEGFETEILCEAYGGFG